MPEQVITSTKVSAAQEFVRADITSIDVENRTFEVVLATETPVRKFDWSDYKTYNEVLECTPEAVIGLRVDQGAAPFLDNHNSYRSEDGLGKLESWSVKSGKVMAMVRMSTRPNDTKLDGIWHDIKDKIRTAISCRYRVHEYQITKNETDNQPDIYRATSWEILEGSTVLIPADPYSGIRSEGEAKKMQIPTDLIEVRSINNSTTEKREEMADIPGTTTAPATPVPVPGLDAEKIRSEAAEAATKEATIAERQRNQEIRQIRSLYATKGVEFTPEFWEKAVTDGSTPDQVRSIAMAEWAKADPNKEATGGAPSVGADREKFQQRMTDAMDLNLNGSRAEADMTPERIEAAQEFRGLSPMRIATAFSEKEDGHNRYDSNEVIAKRALKLGPYSVHQRTQTTSDLPILLTEVTNRTVRREYNYHNKDWEKFTYQTTASDFRDIKRTSMGDLPSLSLVGENQEYKRGGVKDEAETVSIDKYGRMMEISWESFINDDLSALTRVPSRWALAVNKLHNNLAFGELLNNGNLQDGVALFHADHLNLIATGSNLSVTSLAAVFKLMRNQKSIADADGESEYLNLTGKYLIIGPDTELLALQLLDVNTLNTTTANGNPYRGRLEIIIDPLVTGNQWYVVEDPRVIDTIEMRFLNGQRFSIERMWDMDRDCWKFKVRSVCGAKAIDFRGMYKNPGA